MVQSLRNGSRICACRVGCVVVCGDVGVLQWSVSAGRGHVHWLWRRCHRDVLDRDRVNLHVSRCRMSPAEYALRRTSIVFTWIKMHRMPCQWENVLPLSTDPLFQQQTANVGVLLVHDAPERHLRWWCSGRRWSLQQRPPHIALVCVISNCQIHDSDSFSTRFGCAVHCAHVCQDFRARFAKPLRTE